MRGNHIPEASYPTVYREKDCVALASFIAKHESVCLVAMKKVGISNFVRFFFHHSGIKKKYFKGQEKEFLFILCDLNDLSEISLRSFWVLLLKRFSETIATSQVPPKIKHRIDKLFIQAISATDPFFFFDCLRKSIEIVASETNLCLVLFLLRFDRLKDIFSMQFYANLQSLFDTAKYRFLYVTTSVRTLPELCSEIFKGANISTFAHSYFLKPAKREDLIAISSYLNLTPKYSPKITPKIKGEILTMGGGHIVLTRLIGISFSEGNETTLSMDHLLGDERILLTLEEIWNNLTIVEQNFLKRVSQKEKIKKDKSVDFLFQTGILKDNKGKYIFFSPLFEKYLERLKTVEKEPQNEFTKKEKILLDFLISKKTAICSRDEIIEAVWPEYKISDDLTVSDWAIDRLVWRLRKKIKTRQEGYEIITIRDQGYKCIS
jgi:DNA-binding winged helix-turn-helix (wHTH) protein